MTIITKKFEKKFLKALLREDLPEEEAAKSEIVRNKLVDTDRWSIMYDLIFKYEDKYYQVGYSKGATELQDNEQPFEYEADEISCTEVEPVKVSVIKYTPKEA